MAKLYKPPVQNAQQFTLDTQMGASDNSATLNQNVESILQAPGIGWVDRVDSSGGLTPTKREYFDFTGVNGSQLTGIARGLAGSTAQVHAVGAIVEFGPDVIQAQAVYDVITTEHSTNGVHASLPSISYLKITKALYASGASVSGLVRTITFSGVSGASALTQDITLIPGSNVSLYMTSPGVAKLDVSGGSNTGGFRPFFQVPLGLASQNDVGGLVPVEGTYTISYANAFVKTPASLASVSVTISKNNAIIGVLGILAGATFGSSASFSNTALSAGDELRININSTASLATDLSFVIRST